jgi:hypothetical protein
MDGAQVGDRAAVAPTSPTPAPATPGVSPELARALGLLEPVTRAGLVVAVVGLGVWTLVYQVALMADLGVTVTVVVAAVLTALGLYAALPAFRVRLAAEDPGPAPLWHHAVAAGIAVMAIASALLGRPAISVVLIGLGAAAWVVQALRSRVRTGPVPSGPPTGESVEPSGRGVRGEPGEPGLWLTGWLWALACGVLSAVTARPDGDDAYFINLAQWVADRGDFPLRDTMLGDEVFPALEGHNPPIHSLEGLVGSLAWLTGQSGGVLTYVVTAPVFTVVAVLALTWLVSVCRVPFAPLALSASVLYLLAAGGSGASLGNFFALRMWQGKSVLATLVIPLVIAVAVEYLRHGGWRRAFVLVLAVVAAVGASNTAVFLLPVLLGGLLLAALVLGEVRRAAGVALALAYPLACGVAVILLAPPDPEVTSAAVTTSQSLNPLTAVPGGRGLMAATYLGVCLGWLGLRSRVARTVAVCLTLAASFALLPPVTDFLSSAAGVGGVVWRMWWVVPVPLLVGGVVGAAAGLVRGRARAVVAAAVAIGVGLLPLVGGRWIFSQENHTRWSAPTAWKAPVGAEAEARVALRASRPGDVVLAPWDASRVLAGMSVDVHPVSARTLYLNHYEPVKDAFADQRRELQTFADSTTRPGAELRPLLDQLSVDTACVSETRGKAVTALEEAGFTVAARGADLVCLRR